MLTLLVHGGLFECLAMKYDGRMGHGGRTVKVWQDDGATVNC